MKIASVSRSLPMPPRMRSARPQVRLGALLFCAGALMAAPSQAAAMERLLQFVPLDDGREAVLDAQSLGLVRMFGTEENTFLRITVRGLQHYRLTHHLDREQPFRLWVDRDTGLNLEDPLTHHSMALRAFGVAAVAAAAPLLTNPATPLATPPVRCTRRDC